MIEKLKKKKNTQIYSANFNPKQTENEKAGKGLIL